MDEQHGDITQALLDVRTGDDAASDRLWTLVYDELRYIAHRELVRRRGGATLTTTALVHEAYIKLVDHSRVPPQSRTHFFALSCKVMRQILVDYARYRMAMKRGGNQPKIPLEEAYIMTEMQAEELVELDKALTRLSALDKRLSQVVECRYFGGLSTEETAQVMGVSTRTVERDWMRAKAYLYEVLKEDTR